ncbi:bifunctional UDP-sugar hydrolase/5'-nucleotidase [Actinotalea sp. AC32]|nr:bifunctional UDP-sugar hydrolase/5'-nucleotidase [Actinotalea sp. AC32]
MHLTRRRTRRLAPLTAAGVICAAAVVVPPAAAADHLVEIDIVGINDFHGRLEQNRQSAGAASLAGAVQAFETENANTLFVSAGDNIGASTFTSFVADDEPTMDVLELMDLDAAALGNHEFDRGRVDVDDRVLPYVEDTFPYLAANLYDTTTDEPAYQEYALEEVDGLTVAFVGAMTEDLPSLVSPAGIETLEVKPMLPEVNRVAAQLSDGDEANDEADVIVLLVHEGANGSDIGAATGETSFGQLVTGLSDDVHAVFSGHTHQQYAHLVPVDGWAEGVARPVVQGGQYGEALAHVQLTVDPATGDLVGTEVHVVDLVDAEGALVYPQVEAVQDVVDAAVLEADELGSVSLGTVTEDLFRAQNADGSSNRGGESTLGNLVADVQLWATQDLGTEIAFMNPGGLRTDILFASSGEGDPDGNVTFREAAEVQPFANTLVALTMTGEQVVQVLEEQWQPEGAERAILKLGVAGLTYTYDPTAAQGERVTDVWVGDEWLDPAGEYRVVANSFLAAGGDNFTTFADVAAEDRADSGRIDLQAFVDYMDAMSPVSPDLAQRAVGVQLPEAPEGGFAPGSTFEVDLSSLLFSAGEEQGDEVVVHLGDTEVGRADIDPTIVDGTDEVGRATVEVTLPEWAVGTVGLVAHVPGTGTEVWFAVPGQLPSSLVPVEPVRIPTPPVVAPDVPVCIQVGGISPVPAEAVGVVLNVTTVRPNSYGHVVVYPDGATGRATEGSTVNFEPGKDVANTTFVPLSEDGRLCYVTRGAPAAGVLLDVSAFLLPDSGVELQASRRLVDTRPSTPAGPYVGPVTPRTPYEVQVTGEAGVPAEATAVLLNVTVTGPTAPGNLRVFAGGDDVPGTSVVNYAPGQDKANLAMVTLSEDGTVSFWSDTPVGTSRNPVHVILDVVGWVTSEAEYTEIVPDRVLDTRDGAKLMAHQERTLDLNDLADLPADATTVVLNVTAIRPSSVGNLRVYPETGGATPNVSSINYIQGRELPNLVVVAVPEDGRISLYSDQPHGGTVDVAVDVVGWFTADAEGPEPV